LKQLLLLKKQYNNEDVSKICKNEVDFLKSELKAQHDLSEKLNETLSQTRIDLDNLTSDKKPIIIKGVEGVGHKIELTVCFLY